MDTAGDNYPVTVGVLKDSLTNFAGHMGSMQRSITSGIVSHVDAKSQDLQDQIQDLRALVGAIGVVDATVVSSQTDMVIAASDGGEVVVT